MTQKEMDIKKKELEIVRVGAAKLEMEFRILEKMQEVNRIQENIKIQEDTSLKLKTELEQMIKDSQG